MEFLFLCYLVEQHLEIANYSFFFFVIFLFIPSPKRPCNISDVLVDLVGAVAPLAHEQRRAVLLSEVPRSLQVPVEEPALRQALGNLIEGALLRTQAGGKVEIVAAGAPAGGALVIIDDDGLDMHYMVCVRKSIQYHDHRDTA